MPPLWQAVLRFAAEWAVLVLLGGALGIGTAEAMKAGWVSERTVLITFGVLMAAAAAFTIWAARDACRIPWDDWDDWDDDPDDAPATPTDV